ncbi:hypothetical protein [Chromatium okenii]|uniref:hypothetical protein n=1 Tax=Chromatium okenii TaxID=61644 RepID=UPI001F5BD6B9|nr:hypothetical protein [Chromatium okenii]
MYGIGFGIGTHWRLRADVASVMLKIGEVPLPPEPVIAILDVADNAMTMLAAALEAFISKR